MATYNKFNCYVGDLSNKVHDVLGDAGVDSDTLSIYLSNTAPNAENHTIKTDLAEITLQNGYTGPVDISNTGVNDTGTFSLSGDSLTITASGGSIGPFQYVVLFNNTTTNDNLIAWWDYGSEVTLNDGESFTIKFNNSDTTGIVFTLS